MPAHRINPPAGAAEQIQTLASTGFSKVGIAAHFGIDAETLERWFERHPTFKQRFKAGREQERHALHNALYGMALEKGNAAAAMFLLKARHGYREGDQSEQANKVAITFNLPGPLSPEQYELAKIAKAKVVDGNAGDSAKPIPATAAITTRRI